MKVKEYYGTRARIGLVYISSSTVMEPEFYAMAPEGVSINTTRMHLPEVTVKGLRGIMEGDEVERCTRELARAPLHAICFGGTSATFLEGIGWDEKVTARMNAVSNGIPCTTTSTAMLKALRAVGAKKVSFITPYLDEVTERGRMFLEQHGFKVLVARGLNIVSDPGIGAVTTQRTYDFVLESMKPESDAVFISCTNFRTIGAIAPLEEKLKIPVVSSIQASFWECLKLAGTVPTREVKGFGRLFQA